MKDRIEKRPEIRVVQPGGRSGSVAVPSSKSQLHRLLICAALGDAPAEIVCRGIPEDVRATMRCLNALGAKIEEIADGGDSSCKEQLLRVRPLDRSVRFDGAVLDCGGSASTLRFLLPIAGMLGVSCTFMRSGRLPERPLAPYAAQLRANGMYIREEGPLLSVSGRLSGGEYVLPGNISSQFISGLLMAMGGFQGHSSLRVEGAMESTHYVRMTETVLREAGIRFEKEETLSEGGMPVTVWTSGDHPANLCPS